MKRKNIIFLVIFLAVLSGVMSFILFELKEDIALLQKSQSRREIVGKTNIGDTAEETEESVINKKSLIYAVVDTGQDKCFNSTEEIDCSLSSYGG